MLGGHQTMNKTHTAVCVQVLRLLQTFHNVQQSGHDLLKGQENKKSQKRIGNRLEIPPLSRFVQDAFSLHFFSLYHPFFVAFLPDPQHASIPPFFSFTIPTHSRPT
jgi:uncharacterized membrane protein